MSDGILNAVIERATLRLERGFVLDGWVHLDFGGSGQGFGGYALGGTPTSKAGEPDGLNYAGMFIVGVLQAAGCESWEKLAGKSVRVRRENGLLISIGHIILEDKWFTPRDAFKRSLAGVA